MKNSPLVQSTTTMNALHTLYTQSANTISVKTVYQSKLNVFTTTALIILLCLHSSLSTLIYILPFFCLVDLSNHESQELHPNPSSVFRLLSPGCSGDVAYQLELSFRIIFLRVSEISFYPYASYIRQCLALNTLNNSICTIHKQ